MNVKSLFSSALLVVGLMFLTPALAQAQDTTAWQDTTDTMYQDTTDTSTVWEDTTGTAQVQLWKEDNASNGDLNGTPSARATEVESAQSMAMVANRNHAIRYKDAAPVLSSAPR